MPNSFTFLRPLFTGLLIWAPVVPHSLHLLARQSRFSHLSQKSFAQRKEMTFDRRLKTLGLKLFSVYIAAPLKI